MDLVTLVAAAVAAAAAAVVGGLYAFALVRGFGVDATQKRVPKEQRVCKGADGKAAALGSLHDAATVRLTAIIPAYNEEDRLEATLRETCECFDKVVGKGSYEIIVVDDGSRDRTPDIGEAFTRSDNPAVKVYRLPHNMGKGGAVQQGVWVARGERVLFMDADGATDIRDFGRVDAALTELLAEGDAAIAIGSRAHLQADAVARRKWYRTVLMYGFHFLVFVFGVRHIRDTQCGFKLFSRSAARTVFDNQHLQRWCFDVELLNLADMAGIPVREVAVNWDEKDGSKLKVTGMAMMAHDLVLQKVCYAFGIWRAAA